MILMLHPTSRLIFWEDIIASNNFHPVVKSLWPQFKKKNKCQRSITEV